MNSIESKSYFYLIRLFRSRFTKVSQVAPLGIMSSKRATEVAMRSKFEIYTRYSGVADEQQKKSRRFLSSLVGGP